MTRWAAAAGLAASIGMAILGASPRASLAFPVLQEQAPSAPAEAPPVELYPQRRSETVVRFFTLASEPPDRAALSAALGGLGASLINGPYQSTARPKTCFVSLRVPVAVSGKDVAKALRTAGAAARELVCTVLDGHAPSGVGLGVVGAAIAGTMLNLTVELLALEVTGDSGRVRAQGEVVTSVPRATWSTQALYELLAREKLLPP